MRSDDHGSLGRQNYESNRRLSSQKGHLLRRLPLWTILAGCFFFIIAFLFFIGSRFPGYLSQAGHTPVDNTKLSSSSLHLSKETLPPLLNRSDLDLDNPQDHITLENEGILLTAELSLDTGLQKYILRLLRRSRTLKAAVVALDPNDGSTLALASYNSKGVRENVCLQADFPAASIFKIVSAAAAMELAGFTPDQPVSFKGRKHTLYKKQLEEGGGRYVSETSLRRAFASSINSVFGKLGIHYLGKDVLGEYAGKFLFDRPIPFDLPVEMSTAQVPNDDFGLAEFASGFNKTTHISPLHAGMLTATIANNGVMMTPFLVERVLSQSGEVLYRNRSALLASSISMGTAKDLKVLMGDTVAYGTCRKSFRLLRRKKVFKGFEFGAKTGTINNSTDTLKYDWITAYAIPGNRKNMLSIAVLCVHGEKLGTRASELGRCIINYYYTAS